MMYDKKWIIGARSMKCVQLQDKHYVKNNILHNNNYKHDNNANFKVISDIKLSQLQQHVLAWYVNLAWGCANKVC